MRETKERETKERERVEGGGGREREEREGEKTMVFFGSLSNLFCAPLLHKEDYSFDDSVDKNSGQVLREPSENWLTGFKDRKLEGIYLNELAKRSITRILLGYLCYLGLDWISLISYIVIIATGNIDEYSAVYLHGHSKGYVFFLLLRFSPPSLSATDSH